MRDYPVGRRLLPLLRSAVRDSCELLVNAGLLEPFAVGYAVSSGGEVTGFARTSQLALTPRGVALVADGRFGEWTLSYLRDTVEPADAEPRWEQGDD